MAHEIWPMRYGQCDMEAGFRIRLYLYLYLYLDMVGRMDMIRVTGTHLAGLNEVEARMRGQCAI